MKNRGVVTTSRGNPIHLITPTVNTKKYHTSTIPEEQSMPQSMMNNTVNLTSSVNSHRRIIEIDPKSRKSLQLGNPII